jgi:uncharacterized protein YkwD
MPHPGATARHRHGQRRAAQPRPPWLRPMLALLAVLMVLMPVTWVFFRNGGSGMAADNDTPYVEWVDDRYQSAKPTVADWTTSTEPTEEEPSSSPTKTPSTSPTSTPTPSATATPTGRLSTAPTTGPTESGRPTSQPTSPGETETPTPRPTNTTSSPTRPPNTPDDDDGSMTRVERELYNLIGAARADNGCAPLRADSDLTYSARERAKSQADEDAPASTGGGTDAASAQDDARAAYNDMMRRYSSVILDCSMDRLGIGYGDARHCTLLLLCKTEKRWAADFARD